MYFTKVGICLTKRESASTPRFLASTLTVSARCKHSAAIAVQSTLLLLAVYFRKGQDGENDENPENLRTSAMFTISRAILPAVWRPGMPREPAPMLAITEKVLFACAKLIPAGGRYSEFEGGRPASDLTTVVEGDSGLEGPDCGSGGIGRGVGTAFWADFLFFSKEEKRRDDSLSMQTWR